MDSLLLVHTYIQYINLKEQLASILFHLSTLDNGRIFTER